MHVWIHGTIEQALDIYNTLMESENNNVNISQTSKSLLDEKRSELLKMAKVVIPDEYFGSSNPEDEKEAILELSRIQLKLDSEKSWEP